MEVLTFILLFKYINLITSVNTVNPPLGCNNYGYCLPENQITAPSGEVECSDCVCPSGTIKASATDCQSPTTCAEVTCPTVGQWRCALVSNEPTCMCQAAYAAPSCTLQKSDPCSSIPCLNRGKCTGTTSYKCECDVGTYGEQCQYEPDPCLDKCKNGGICEIIDRQRVALCKCPVGYVGINCETAETPTSSFVGCYGQTYVFSTPQYFLYTGSVTNGKDCVNALLQYLKTNPQVNYRFSTYYARTKECWFSEINHLTQLFVADNLLDLLLQALLVQCPTANNLDPGMQPVYEVKTECDKYNKCSSNGYCYNTVGASTGCVCNKGYSGSTCTTVDNSDPCKTKSCGIGSCKVTDDGTAAYCICPNGDVKMDTCGVDSCSPNPCQYGGTCENTPTGYTCNCLNLYTGLICSDFNACYENKCLNGGACKNIPNGLSSTYSCDCLPGFIGDNCETEIFACDTVVCENNGVCKNGPSFTYTCECTQFFRGVNCEIDIDECLENPTLCTTKDSTAKCINTFGGYECQCSDIWLGTKCTINKIIYDILESTHGNVLPEELNKLTEDLMSDPTIVRDIIPFLIGGYPLDVRMDLSWDYDDIFIWVAYEEKLIDVRTDFVRWNDKVLGNCFTFNHMNSSLLYKGRGSGVSGGLELQTNVQQKEYLPWIETAAILVFTHNWDESIFAESPRINCRPNNLVQMNVQPIYYERLGGRFGKCVKKISEVTSYYYGGSYTTDGCLRSCYQDVIKNECGCMDPRYPAPEDEESCSLANRLCIESASNRLGDPSKWKQCNCPLPCSNTIYNVAFSETSYKSKKTACELKRGKLRDECYEQEEDKVLLRTSMPSLIIFGFIETEAFGLTSFLSRLGGLLGILMGISAICLIEFIFLISQLIFIFCSNTKFTAPLSKNRSGIRNSKAMKW